jgi:prevent-host-death family protein
MTPVAVSGRVARCACAWTIWFDKLVGMKGKTIGAFDAKTRLSELLDRVHKTGEVYIITKRGVPVAELRPPTPSGGLRYGSDAGRISIADDFDAPVSDFAEYSK